MFAYTVPDMSCEHCAQAITRAVAAVDARALVSVDLGRKLVTVDSQAATDERLRAAIVDAGYSRVLPTTVSAASA